MTNLQHNGRKMYSRNKTALWIRHRMDSSGLAYLRKKARSLGASGIAKKERQRQVEYDRQMAASKKLHLASMQEKRDREIETMRSTKLLTLSELQFTTSSECKIPDSELKTQLKWYRKIALQVFHLLQTLLWH